MEQKKTKIKFARLCLSQTQRQNSSSIGSKAPSVLNTNNSQISNFFLKSKSVDECSSKTSFDNNSKDSSTSEPALCTTKITNEGTQNPVFIQNEDMEMESGSTPKAINEPPDIPLLKKSECVTKIKKQPLTKISEKIELRCPIKKYLDNENNESLAEFETPRKIPRKSPATPKQLVKKKTSKAKKQQPDIRKVWKQQSSQQQKDQIFEKLITQHSRIEHVDVDQLQIALALSKSIADVNEQENVDDKCSISNATKNTIQQFGFKSKCKENDFVALYGVPSSGSRNKWKSKYTPLTRRSQDIQKKKQVEYVEQLLLNNIMVESNSPHTNEADDEMTCYEITSKSLQRHFVPEALLFTTSSNDTASNKNIQIYYTNNLVEMSTLEAGVLLRDWSTIPGRDSIFDCIPKKFIKTDQSDIASQEVQSAGDEQSQEKSMHDIATCSNPTETSECMNEDVEQQSHDVRLSPVPTDGLHVSEAMEVDIPNVEHEQNTLTQKDCIQCEDEEDVDKTILINNFDIQQKLDLINCQIRNSQQIESSSLSSQDDGNTSINDDNWVVQIQTGSQSPDLFDFEMDDLDTEDPADNIICDKDASHEINAIKSPSSSEVIEIFSNETDDLPTISISQKFSTNVSGDDVSLSQKRSDYASDDDISLSQKRSSNASAFLEAATETQTLSNSSNGNINCTVIEILDDSSSSSSEHDEMINNSIAPRNFSTREIEDGAVNTKILPISTNSKSCRELSITEQLEVYERGFQSLENTQPYSIAQAICIVNETNSNNFSISPTTKSTLSEDSEEISENKRTVIADVDLIDEVLISNANLLESIDSSTSTTKTKDFGAITEEDLISQSICDIFQRSFNYSALDSPTEPKADSKFKKMNSESVIQSKVATNKTFSDQWNYLDDNGRAKHSFNNERQSIAKELEQPFESDVSQTKDNSHNESNEENTVSEIVDLSNDEYIVKYEGILVKPDYEHMDLADIQLQLKKYGLKTSLKRHQAVICLNYIYNRTHPFIEENPGHLAQQLYKPQQKKNVMDSNKDEHTLNFNIGFSNDNLVNNLRNYQIEENNFLPSWPRNKKPWCLQPLHIAWYNLIKANSQMDEYLLFRKPFYLKDLKNYLKTIDMNFDNKDLSAFLKQHDVSFLGPKKK